MVQNSSPFDTSFRWVTSLGSKGQGRRRVDQPQNIESANMNSRCFYRGYYLSAVTTVGDDARYRARVAIMALDGERTRSQRFVDLDVFDTKGEADHFAIEGGKAWVDIQIRQDQLAGVSTLAPLN